uniref:Orf511 n=1 Tax=Rhizophydium sp. 136 TaxID=60187 RepID=Q950M8_9FUNG|nr:orf511 [Rhizophydium sp. 136]AAK84280.1 orf511 [Rhizophydium sp. 136]
MLFGLLCFLLCIFGGVNFNYLDIINNIINLDLIELRFNIDINSNIEVLNSIFLCKNFSSSTNKNNLLHPIPITGDDRITLPALEFKEKLKEYKNLPGCYIFTNCNNGYQLIGESKDLGIRLKDYFSEKEFRKRKTPFFKDLKDLGFKNFTLTIIVLDSKEDALNLEFFYLKNYICKYNTKRHKGAMPNISKSNLLYVYDRITGELINGKPFVSMQKAASALTLDRPNISAAVRDEEFYNNYFFSKVPLTEIPKDPLDLFKVYAYKDNKLINGKPFKNAVEAEKELDISAPSIRKAIKDNMYSKNMFFSNKPLNELPPNNYKYPWIKVYVYKDGIEIKGSPFRSSSKAAEVIDIHEDTIRNSLSKNSLSKGYFFSKIPIEDFSKLPPIFNQPVFIYIYKDGKEIEGSPLKTSTEACQLTKVSKAEYFRCLRYKRDSKGYYFSKTPITNFPKDISKNISNYYVYKDGIEIKGSPFKTQQLIADVIKVNIATVGNSLRFNRKTREGYLISKTLI